MIVWHGSNVPVGQPDTMHSRARVDFGQGFYVTPIREQACRLCARYLRLGQAPFLSRYVLDEAALGRFTVLRFPCYDDSWLEFVLSCRRGLDRTSWDVVWGGVANDKVFNTVELFFNGLIQKDEALRRLRFAAANEQICFRTQAAIDACLRYEGSERL